MFSQVYYHPIRLIYDHHLRDFLDAWLSRDSLLQEGTFPTDVEGHLRMTDDEVNAAMRNAACDPQSPGHFPAHCIMGHCHFKRLYERDPQDAKLNSEPGAAIAAAAAREFGADAVRYTKPKVKNAATDFPVRGRDGRVQSAISVSETLSKLQPTAMEYVFIDPQLKPKAKVWLDRNRDSILAAAGEQEDEEHEAQPESGTAHVAEPRNAQKG
jgi:hypothetical protein